MKNTLRISAVGTVAFAAGLGAAHLMQPASAAAAPLTPAIYDLSALQAPDMPNPNPATPNLRSKLLVAADGMTAAVQIGTVYKHFHSDANEIQIVIAGSGTEWLGDKQVPLKAGAMLVIPAGTPHGGTTDPSLKIVSIKTPPQAPADIHPAP